MPDYKNGKIYKIVSDQTDKVYIGSTIQTLAQRFTDHKKRYREHVNKANIICLSAFDILKYDDAQIILIELFPCSKKCELESREYHHIKLEENTVNKRMPSRPIQEWRNDNKLIIAQKKAEQYQRNKEHILEKVKTYYKKNKALIDEKHKAHFICECGCEYSYSHKTRHLKSKKHLSFLNIIDE